MIQLKKIYLLKDKDTLAVTIHYVTMLAIAIFIPYHLIVKNWSMLIFDMITVLIFMLISVVYKVKRYYLGKVMTLSVTMLFAYLLSFKYLPLEIGMNLFFFLLAISALVIFDYGVKKERFTAIVFSITNVLLVIISEILGNKPIFEMSEESVKFQRIANIAVFGILLTGLLFLYNSALYRAEKKLERLASTDTLTGIYNRRTLIAYGEEAFEKQSTTSKERIVMIFDIDNFKQINDQYGHLAGDMALIEITQLAQKEIREGDIFGRYGGEEFVLIGHGSREEAQALAEKIRSVIEVHKININENTSIGLTISVGVCTTCKAELGLEEMINRADKALYEAKAKGRNKTVFAKKIQRK